MTPNMLPLYAASFALIGLLGAFAHHNKRTGWVRKRRSYFDDLLELQAFAKDLEGAVGSEPVADARMGVAPSVHEVSQFSAQLKEMNASLKTAARAGHPAMSREESAVEAEHVSA